jgi:methyl-accepting chemotaxis protein
MRINHPITQREYELREGAMLVSMTDPKGRITFVNEEFVQVSGFSESELLGKAHNIVRHPDMPEEAFADLWKTLQSGRPWTALVKNRCKNGDFYWVLANVTPVRSGAEVTGYMSVRSKPTREQVSAAEEVYRAIREKRAAGRVIREGKVVTTSVSSRLNVFRNLSLTARAALSGACLAVPAFAGVSSLLTRATLLDGHWKWLVAGTLTAATFAGLFGYVLLFGRIARTLRASASQVEELTQGRFDRIFETDGNDELAGLQRALQCLRTKVGFELADSRRVAIENTRIRKALDIAAANVMVADASHHIIYVNESLHRMLSDAQADIRRELPAFDAQALVGSNIDQFHSNPAHQQAVLASLKDTHKTRLTLGGRKLDLVINPVVENNGNRLGTVVEWSDRTQELRMEQELQDMLSAVVNGDLTTRIDLAGKAGYFEIMSRGINRFADNMSELVYKAKSLASEVYRSAGEISRGNEDLSQRTEEQSSSLEETAASMEQMTATVRQNAASADQANQLASTAREQAENGGAIVDTAVSAMIDINAASGKMADIISVIDEIAFQTNLLALNAAVEAARAGEQGRGFAVVATEVRNLAGRSATAAKQIKELITDSVQKVEHGSALVGKSGHTLEKIVTSVKEVSDIVAAIASASAEQSGGIEQVNQAVMQMDQITQQNAALVEQATAASRALADQALELSQMMERYRLIENASNAAASHYGGQPTPAIQQRRAYPTRRPARRAQSG